MAKSMYMAVVIVVVVIIIVYGVWWYNRDTEVVVLQVPVTPPATTTPPLQLTPKVSAADFASRFYLTNNRNVSTGVEGSTTPAPTLRTALTATGEPWFYSGRDLQINPPAPGVPIWSEVDGTVAVGTAATTDKSIQSIFSTIIWKPSTKMLELTVRAGVLDARAGHWGTSTQSSAMHNPIYRNGLTPAVTALDAKYELLYPFPYPETFVPIPSTGKNLVGGAVYNISLPTFDPATHYFYLVCIDGLP